MNTERCIREAAREYHRNVNALRAGEITVEQHRAENRRIRETLTEDEWERAKFRALNQI